MATLCNVAEEIAEGSMKKATIGVKEYMIKNGVLEVPPEADLSKEKMNIGVTVDGSWLSRVGPQNRKFYMFALKIREKQSMQESKT